MGHRSNLIVRQGASTALYYDHWAGHSIDLELFFGAEAALAWVEQRDPVGVDELVWDPWCEGALWMDVDARRVLWYGGCLAERWSTRQVFLPMMREQWPGWTVDWAAHGLLEIFRAAGIPHDPRGKREPADTRLWSERRFRVPSHVVAVRRGGDTTTRWLSLSPRVLEGGERAFQRVYTESKMLGVTVARPQRFDRAGPARGRPTLEEEVDLPSSGILVDHDARVLRHWWSWPASLDPGAIEAAWPGWTVHHDRDDPRPFLAAVPAAFELPELAEAEVRASILEVLGRRLEHDEIPNPIEGVVARMDTEGCDVRVSDAAREHRGRLVDGDGKRSALDALRRMRPEEE